jgi:PKD repeat protein
MSTMKKLIFLVLVSISIYGITFAQVGNGMWTWMHGDTTGNTSAVYGTQGVASSLNKPAGTMDGVFWTDKNGRFWLYGGSMGINDMWMFDPSTNQWTWESGAHSGYENTGTMGVPALSNTPGAIQSGAVHWTDTTGNLWMFGGNYSPSNKLWKYDVSTKQWTWMRGSAGSNSMGSYGTMGVSSSSNDPCSRYRSTGWVDKNNNLWLFGGCFNTQYNDYLNDVWKYNISLNQWTWVSGKDPHTNWNSVGMNNGTVGTPSPTNTPGSRYSTTVWADANGNGYIFGGMTDNGTQSPDYYNDFWKFDVSIGQWICLRANGTAKNYLNSPTCVPDKNYCLPGEYTSSACWKDTCGNFWMFGGLDNEYLWNYNIVMDKWTLTNNTLNQTPLYGTCQVAAPKNHVGKRNRSCAWVDKHGCLWLFGGYYQKYVTNVGYQDWTNNDMWRFKPDTNCTTCKTINYNVHSDFSHSYPNSPCTPVTFNFTNASVNATSYLWNFGDLNTSTVVNPIHAYSSPGIFPVTLIASNGVKSDTTTYNMSQVYQQPIASFTPDYTTGCTPLTVHFTNSSTQGHWAYDWNFGYSYYSTSTIKDPVYTYVSQGVYNVSLIVRDTLSFSGLCRDTATAVITVNPTPVANAGSDRSVCLGSSIVLTASGGTTYTWSNGVTNGAPFYPTHSDTYILTVTNSYNCSAIDTMKIFVHNLPPTPTISQNMGTLTSTASYGNQWYYNNGIISGAHSQTYIPLNNGNYYVIVTDSNGCKSDTSNIIYMVVTDLIYYSSDKNSVWIYPNPALEKIIIEIPNAFHSTDYYNISIKNLQGQELLNKKIIFATAYSIDVSSLSNGIYFLSLRNEEEYYMSKFIIQK